jgi:hypothetical protein
VYYQGGVIDLAAADNGTLGVKATYYSLDGGAPQAGTRIVLPAAPGTTSYTLSFWSEDWSGNVEAPHPVNLTVAAGNATLRLVWGNSDVSGTPCSGEPDAAATWTVRTGAGSGTLVASGSGRCPDWDGVDDIALPVMGTTVYTVIVDWYDSWLEDWDQTRFSNVTISTPGQVVRLGY